VRKFCPLRKSYFYKVFTENSNTKLTPDLSAQHEIGTSQIASYISSGLIPEGKLINKNGIIYPYLNIDSKTTEHILYIPYQPSYLTDYIYGSTTEIDYKKLTPEQRVELFINMLCDIVLLNPDLDTKHLGITQRGHLISFNKGHAYSEIFEEENIKGFSISNDFFSKSNVYKDFIQKLKNHPEDVENLLDNELVQEAFLRIKALTVLPAEKEYIINQTLAPLFIFIKQQTNNQQLINDYFKILLSIPDFLAKQLNNEKCFTDREISFEDTKEGVSVVTFNPKNNKVILVSAKEAGFPKGARVEDIAANSYSATALNGGFFTEGERSASKIGHYFGKINSYMYSIPKATIGISIPTIGTNYAFPSAILKTNGKLLSDTSNYLPAMGISDSGDIKFGEVKVAWNTTLSENGEAILLSRSSDINPDTTDGSIRYKDGSDIKEIVISDNKVASVKIVPDETQKKPNCYYLLDKEYTKENIDKLKSLKIGDYISYGYKLVAVAYPREKGIIDHELTSFFNNCPYVVSGGQLYINKGEIDPRANDNYGGIGGDNYARSAICLYKDGKVSFLVYPNVLTNKGHGLLKMEFIEKYLQKCEYAMRLDSGESTTMVVNTKGESQKSSRGYNRVVSDIVVVMPHYSNTLLSQYSEPYVDR